MSPEKGILEYYENIKRDAGETGAAEFARVLREQYGDLIWPGQIVSDQEAPLASLTVMSMRSMLGRDISRQFVKAALAEGAHLQRPHVSGLTQEGWIKKRNILGAYLISNATQKEIAQIYGLDHNTISVHIRGTLTYLWQNSSPELQARFILPDRKEPQKKPALRKESPAPKKPAVLPEERPMHPRLREALSGIKFIFLDPRTREFLIKAIEENTLTGIPIRNRNIFGTYYISRATLLEVGNIYGISGERVRQISSSVFNEIWLSAPDSLQEEFPSNTIPFKKSTNNLPPEWLLVQDNLGPQIIEALEREETAEEMTQTLGISRHQLILRLRLLRNLGFTIPADLQRSKNENTALAQKLTDETLSDEEIQALLNQVRLGVYRVNTCGENPVLIPITNLVFSLGYHPTFIDRPLFIASVRAVGIPTGHIAAEVKSGPQKGFHEYYFIASVHKERVGAALEQDQALQRFKENPVEQISGPNMKLPTTGELMPKNKLFRSPSHIFQELGIKRSQYVHFNLGEIFNSACPVPVFRIKHGHSLYYPINQEEALRAYIKQKLENKDSVGC